MPARHPVLEKSLALAYPGRKLCGVLTSEQILDDKVCDTLLHVLLCAHTCDIKAYKTLVQPINL